MRRSSAPSQLGGQPAKRPRLGQGIDVIYSQPSVQSLNYEQSSLQISAASSCVQPEPSVSAAVHKFVPTFGAKQKAHFRPPLTQITPVNHSPLAADVVPCEAQSENYQYFNVMWCKASKKKHKKWEGDAVLSARGRCVVLYDMDGKDIGHGSGYKATMLASLMEDQTLFVGGKEVQIMGILPVDDFKSGKCFLGQPSVSEDPSPTPVTRVIAKPFVNPQKAGSGSTHQSFKPVAQIPGVCMFDATGPDALVMPRPSQSHQWQHNKQGLPVVDVVVDPHISFSLRPHQRDGITFLYECVLGMRNFMGTGAILADDMGLGKTLQCIALIWMLMKQGPYNGKAVIKRVLIITPGSLVKNWKQEFNKWLGSERLAVFAVGQDNRVEAFTKQNISRVLIISYEMFVRSVDLLNSLNFDIVICDEGHRLKNTNIKTTSLIMSLDTRRRIVLTGTPIQNDLQEFYSLVEFVNPGVLGSSATFHHVFESAIVASRQPDASAEQIRIGEERATELTRLTKLFVLRRTQDINNEYLPPKLDLVLFCRPSSLQLALYNHLLSSRIIRSCLDGISDGAPHLMCIAALKKLCNHPALMWAKANEIQNDATLDIQEQSIYRGLFNVYPSVFLDSPCDACHSGKLTVLAALLRGIYHSGQKERVVLVSNHTQTLDLLQQFCIYEGYSFLRLDGQTPTGQRQDIVKRFNSPYAQEFVFLLSSKAGGVGLNLIGASRLVLYDIDWNPANDLQAMARVWREGQKKTVHIYRLITTGTIEEKMYQRQISKQGLCGAVMEKHTKKDVQFSLDDLRDLFSLNELTACDTHDLLSCNCDSAETGHSDATSKPSKHAAVRSCQLGATAQHAMQRSLTMDELLDWHHIRVTEEESLPESWCLSGSQQTISYLFWNKNKGRKLTPGDT